MGLLDFLDTPGGQGLLAAGLGALGSRSTLGGISRGGLLGLQTYVGAQDRKKQGQMFDIQLKQAQQGQQDQTDLRNLAQQFYKAPSMTMDQVNAAPGQVGPTNARAEMVGNTQPAFDTGGFINAYMAKDPLKAMQLKASMAKESPFGKVDAKDFTTESVQRFAQTGNYGHLVAARKKDIAPDGRVYDPYSVQAGQSFSDPNKPFSVDSTGKVLPNGQFQAFELNKSKAGAPSVNVKNDIKMGESLAGQIGPMVKEGYTAAQGAVQTANAANQVISALDKGGVVTGPLSSIRMTGMQVADSLGIAGKDTQERLVNTRNAIQGLAQMTLQGRKQMSGQGAITESEGKLAERAISGDINMTPVEIRTLANASRRAAQFTYQQHQTQYNNMKARPDLSGMADFYKVPEFPAEKSSTQAAPSQGGAKFLGFE